MAVLVNNPGIQSPLLLEEPEHTLGEEDNTSSLGRTHVSTGSTLPFVNPVTRLLVHHMFVRIAG